MSVDNIKLRYFFMFLLGGATVISAQDKKGKEDNLSREMTLEREYNPSVQDANKVNTLPEVKEPTVKKTSIDYASYAVPANPQKEINILSSGSLMTDVEFNKRRGYLNLGGGTNLNLNGDFGYHVLDTEKDKLNIFLSHRSTNGNVSYMQDYMKDEKVKAKLNDNLGGVSFSHGFDKTIMKLGVKYGYSSFNYYGLPGDTLPTFVAIAPLDIETNQVNQQIHVNGGVESKEDAVVSYMAKIDYINFSRKYGLSKDYDGPKENNLAAIIGVSSAFGGNQRVGLRSNFNYLTYSIPQNASGADLAFFENRILGTITPFYNIEGDDWNVNLGANMMFYTGDSAKIFVSPNISADVKVAEKTVLYMNALGELRSNSAWQLSRENRYVNPITGILPSRNWLDATIGLKSGVIPGFWFNIFAGYKATNDDYFFITFRRPEYFGNVSDMLTLDSKLIRGGLEMKYSYQALFDVTLKGVYNNWTVDSKNAQISISNLKAFGRPQMEFTAGLNVKPIDKLSIAMEYYLATGREMYIGTNDFEKMNNINELNLSGVYNINKTFGAYLKLNNVLFQKYEMYYGYPLQSFGAMVGININF